VPVADVTGRTESLVLVSGVDVTERRRLEREKERERAFLNAIANNAPSPLCLIDDSGRLTDRGANLAFEQLLGRDPSSIGGQVFWDEFVAEEDRDSVRELVELAKSGETVGEHDHRWVTSSGRKLLIAWTCVPLPKVDERTLFLVSGVDVTERQRREEEIRAGEERFRAVIESAPVAIAEIGLDDTVRLWNRAAERIFGWRPDEVLGRPPRWVPEDLRHEFRRLSDQEAAGVGYTGHQTVRAHRDGRRLDVEISAAPIRDASGQVVGAMAVMSDISDRKRYERELRASRARLVAAGDEERQRLERNLHDGAQQRLVALSVSLRLAESKLADDPQAAAEMVAGAREELTHALEELRELARGIHPAVLTDRGLAPALEALVSRAPLPVEIDVPPDRLPPAVEAASYYVVAEALTNVAKYARASAATVQVTQDNGLVVIQVSDDGAGGADPSRGSGLRGLSDRVASLDGRLVIESPIGRGTRVRAEIPVFGETTEE
jgi:PAS domain S-box-containing protein